MVILPLPIFVVPVPVIVLVAPRVPADKFNVPAFVMPFVIARLDAPTLTIASLPVIRKPFAPETVVKPLKLVVPVAILISFWVTELLKVTVPE